MLGSVAAERLGIADLDEPVLVWIADRLVERRRDHGLAAARARAGPVRAGRPRRGRGAARLRWRPDDDLRPRRARPARRRPRGPPGRRPIRSIRRPIEVSRPSDAIEARAAAASAFTTLFLGLGAVAVLVGALGIANVMLMAVLERRNEIGLRRALGATRGHIVGQFLAEAVLLAGVGGVAGALLGSLVAAAYAVSQGWLVALPVAGVVGGVAGGRRWSAALAGFYPALRAANTPPTDALRA